MIRVAWVRGAYLNAFEGQNYVFEKDIRLTGIASRFPIHKYLHFPVIKFFSMSDLQTMPGLREILLWRRGVQYLGNRVLGDTQNLIGLEQYTSEFNIFHTADPHYYYSYQLARLRKAGSIKKLIVTSWETIPFNNESIAIKKRNKYAVLEAADWFICYTRKAKDVLIQEGVEARRIDVVSLGVDLKRFHPKEKVGNADDQLTILFVGRLVKEKGVHLVQEVLKRVQKKVATKIELRIVGSSIDYSKMPSIYQESDIFVLPSQSTSTWEEQYGMVLIEAMASGLPIITTRTGAIPEVVGEAAFLVAEKNLRELENALSRLVDDPKVRHQLGKRAHTRAQELYDSRITSRKIGTIYQKVFDL